MDKTQEAKFMRELNLWCYHHIAIRDKIESEKVKAQSQWDDDSDQTFLEDKLFINKMTQRYTFDNEYILKYLDKVTLIKLTDTYTKSITNKYEPGEQKDAGTILSNKLQKVIKKQNLEEERDSIAFYNIQELGRGTFGAVCKMTTNSVVVGTEVKIAVKSIFDRPKSRERLSKG